LISDFGVWEFKDPSGVAVELANAELLTILPQESLPPVVKGTTGVMKDILASGLGKMGEGMAILVYDGKRISRCTEGVLWINYLQERYEYQTPLPGCE